MKHNPNKGTPRGRKAIRASVATYGAGRSISRKIKISFCD